ncbi:MAG: PEP-utilizing enzyme [archaeon]
MKEEKNLLKEKQLILKNREWYHQRFDGSPYLIHMIAENELRDERRKKRVGGSHTLRVCFFQNDRADWYIIMEDLKKTTKAMIRLAKTEPTLSKKLLKDWEKDEKAFFETCKYVKTVDLEKLSNNQLIKLHNMFFKAGSKRFTSSSIIDGFALGSDEIIAAMVIKMLKEKGLEKNYPQIFSKLTAPVKQSFINEAEISLLRLAKHIKKNNELAACIKKKGPKDCVKMLDAFPEIKKEMKKHIENYYWSKNNYVMSYYLDEAHWFEEMKDMFKQNLDIDEQIRKIKTTPGRNRLVKMELMKKLKITKHLKTLLVISEDLTWWQDERKRATYWNSDYSTKILTEIGKRTGFSLHELKYMIPEEVSEIFKKSITKKEAKERMKSCALLWVPGKFQVITGKDVEKLRYTILGDQKKSDIKEFTGLCASVGKVTGRVKICKSATEVGKVKKGDILVAIMTRPDYVIGMKKAAAIVTNEGGVTSHAAIVARELGIPCIIGTKIATQVLKDNDLIEVDADKGKVTIL